MQQPKAIPGSQSPLAIILPSLFGGGAERVATELANHWTSTGRKVSIITIDALHDEQYPLDERVQKIGLGLFRDSTFLAAKIWNNRLRVSRLSQAIRKAQASQVVSFTDITNVTTLLACRRLPIEVIVCERTDPRSHRLGRVWSTLRSQTYGKAGAIVVQTNGVASWAESQHWHRPVYVVPNAAPLSNPQPPTAPRAEPTRKSIVALGRLSPEKGFDLLIEAFARVAADHPHWDLRIAGDGTQRNALTSLVASHGIQHRVSFEGWTSQSETVLHGSDVFALPSRYEGFPNALLEAMAAGLACVAFDCDSGPRDIIRPGTDGLLVPREDVAQLAVALSQLMSDEPLRRQLGTAARDVTERFSRERIFRLWDAVLNGMPLAEFKSL